MLFSLSALAQPPLPTGIEVKYGPSAITLEATRTDSLTDHRAFRMHFYLKLDSKAAWDDQASPGGSAGGTDSPLTENDVTDTALWTGLTVNTAYDIRVRVAAYSDELDSMGNAIGWVYSDWVERQVTTGAGATVPLPTVDRLRSGETAVGHRLIRTDSLAQHRSLRMHFYLKLASKAAWDDQTNPGGDPGGGDSPINNTMAGGRAVWTGLTANTAYDVRVRVAAYSDVLDASGIATGWVYSDWVENQIATGTGESITVPVPTEIELKFGPSAVSLKATRTDSLPQHRSLRMHFYLKLDSKATWDDQASPGGDPGGSDSPMREDDATDTGLWTALTVNMAYDVRVRVAAYSDELDSNGDVTGWVYSDWVERQVTTAAAASVPVPAGVELKYGPSAITLEATRTDSLAQHRAFRMHFYLKLDSKAAWDDQASPGGSAGGTDSPLTENDVTDTALWTGLTVNTAYDIRVRVAAYSDELDSMGNAIGWVYSDWVERQVTTAAAATVPVPTGVELNNGPSAITLEATRTDNLTQHRSFRMHFYLKLDSKAAWDDQASPGGSAGGTDSPLTESDVTDTGLWTGLAVNTAYDIRVRVAAYSDVLDSNGDVTGWVYSDWVERQVTTAAAASVPVPTDVELKYGPSAITLEATRTDSLTDHRAFRLHFYLKLDSKAAWDDQASPGGSAGGTDSPLTESDVTDTGLWTGLAVNTAYDIRVRVAAYSDVLDSNGDVTGWVYSDWVERQVTTAAAASVPVPTGVELKYGPSAITLEATRTDSLAQHRAFRMHFYLKLDSKAAWDDQASPGGSAGGTDSPLTENDVTDTALWTGLTVNTAYDIRVRVAAYSDVLDSNGDVTGWVYSDWVERQVTTAAAATVPVPTGVELNNGPSAITLEATRTDSLTDHRAFRLHFYLKLDSKAAWDDQASPGGSAGGTDSPLTESDVTDTGLWTGLAVNTAYDIRVRVAAYSDVLDSNGDVTGWVYSDWVERQVTTAAAASVPVPSGLDVSSGPTSVSLEATRVDSLTQHRSFRMHFYLKLDSKAAWDDQASPGGDPGGSDSPMKENDATDTAVWTGLVEGTAYDLRVRVAAYSDVLDSNGDPTGWMYSDWVQRQVTTSAALAIPAPTGVDLKYGPSAIALAATRTDSVTDHRAFRMHFYLKLDSKSAWDDQASPGGSAGGTDNPLTESDMTDTALWTGLTVDTTYDVRVRVAAYSDVLDEHGNATGWVYSNWVERQVTTAAGAAVPVPTGVQVSSGPSTVSLEATRTDSLTQHRVFRMHFYLKLDSKAAWDNQALPGGDPGGSDSPMRENDTTDTAVWTGLTVNTAYDIRVRVAAYSDVLDSSGDVTGWVYSDWVERQVTTAIAASVPVPTGVELKYGPSAITLEAARTDSLTDHRAFRMHFYLKLASKSAWDDQASPGGSAGGTDSPLTESDVTDTALWTGLTVNTAYDVRVRVAAYSDVLDSNGDPTGWVYSDWVERQVTTGAAALVPAPTGVQVNAGSTTVSLDASRTDSVAQQRAFRMHFYLKPASKSAWDDQANPGGDPGGTDSPERVDNLMGTARWSGLTEGTTYDVRVRVAAYSDVLNSNGDATGWVYSDWVEQQVATGTGVVMGIPAPTDIELKFGPSAVSLKATRTNSLADHRSFRMHFYLKPASKAAWDDQTDPGGDPGGTDSPKKENSVADTAVWTGLLPDTAYDVRVRVVVYSDVLDSNSDPTGWVYSDWVERQVTTGAGAAVPAPTGVQASGGLSSVSMRATRTDNLAQHRALRMHFYLKPASKAAWDDQVNPGGSAGGSDGPLTKGAATVTAVWKGLTGDTAYDVRVRVAAYSDVLDSNGDATGWVYSDWAQQQATARTLPRIPAPTDIELQVGSTTIEMTATRVRSLSFHREFRMHFYLKPASREAWDHELTRGGDPSGNDSPIKETGPIDTASWSELTAGTTFDVRVRVSAYVNEIAAWRYSSWVEHQVTTSTGLRLPTMPVAIMEGGSGSYEIALLTAPTADVAVTVTSDSEKLTVDSDAGQPGEQNDLSFTPNNWNTAQTVTLTAQEDADLFAETVTLTHMAVSTDTTYDTAEQGTVTVTVADNDACPNTMDAELLSDCKALLDARDDLQGTFSLNWSPSADVTDWEGVTVGGNNRVTKLDLKAKGLDGTIPAALGNLSMLEELRFHENHLAGAIPPELGQLMSLTILWLSGNQLTGRMPPDLGDLSNLKDLRLYENELSGAIPFELGRLTGLTTLRLSGNQLTGEIPSALGDLVNLRVLRLHANRLTESIPSSLGGLSNLERLYLNDNELNGTIPPELGNLTKLQRLYLYNNNLAGAIPSELENLKMLPRGGLRLYGNQLSGCIPASLASHKSHIEAQQDDVDLVTCAPELELSAREAGISMVEGTIVTYTVRLKDVRPAVPVTVEVRSDNGRVTVDTNASLPGDQNDLIFSSENWSDEQAVTVHADSDVGENAATLSHSATSADTNYTIADAGSVSVTVRSEDAHGKPLPSMSSFSVTENNTAVGVLANYQRSGNGVLSYVLAGADAPLFRITQPNEVSPGGELSFLQPPDYEQPNSASGDNTYRLTLMVTSGSGTDETLIAEQRVQVMVVDDNENLGPQAATPLPDLSLEVGGESEQLDIGGAFTHSSGYVLTFFYQLDRDGIVDVSDDTILDDTILNVTAQSRGTATLTVTATDSSGLFASQTVSLTVTDAGLRKSAERSLAGFGRSVIASVSSQLRTRLNRREGGRGAMLRRDSRWSTDGELSRSLRSRSAVASNESILAPDAETGIGLPNSQDYKSGNRRFAVDQDCAGCGPNSIEHDHPSSYNTLGIPVSLREPTHVPDVPSGGSRLDDRSACSNPPHGAGVSWPTLGTGRQAFGATVQPMLCPLGSGFIAPMVGAPNPRQLPQGSSMVGLDRALSLLPNNFALNLNRHEGMGAWTLWGARDRQSWNGDGHDGDVSSLYLGLDYQVHANWTIGVSVARNGADSRYRHGWASRELDMALTTILPYASYRTPDDRSSFWGVAGLGSGTLDSMFVGAVRPPTALDMSLYMAGGRHRLARFGRLEMSLTGDLALVGLDTGRGEETVESLDAGVSRIRAGLDLSWTWKLANTVGVISFGELSVRRDGGNEGDGAGLEFSGGVRVTKDKFRLEAQGRTLVLHSENHYSERGYSLLATFSPAENGKGLTASAGSQWGASATDTGMIWDERLLTTSGTGATDRDGRVTWIGHLAYGFLNSTERVLLTPFVDANLADSRVRGIQTGARIKRLVGDRVLFNMDISLGGTAREDTGMNREVSVKVQARF